LVKHLDKKAVVINEEGLPYGYEFMPHADKIKKISKKLWGMRFGCFVVLDCSDLRRCGEVGRLASSAKTILNIDHHISNEKFGDVNWVDPKAASCTEMVYQLYKKLRIPFDKDAATLLYTGIVTDTGSFRYVNTNRSTHLIAAELLKFDLDVAKIYKVIYENVPFSDMQLLSNILPTIKRDPSGKIAWFQIRKKLLKNRKVYFDLTENILTFARAIRDVEVAVLFKENLKTKNEIRVNLRSQGRVDVNKIASFFGGGGHRTASGCTVKGDIETVSRMVLRKIRESI
ncbi:MAG: DHH family phosphoesterase, partial [Deltaproteobacteria bacterium]